MTPTFTSPWTFDPSYSLLGRAFRRWTGDRLRGEALFIVALTGLALALLMSHYLGWALLKPLLSENPHWQLIFWTGQLASVVIWAGIGLLGVRPSVTVSCTPTAVKLEQGARSETIPYKSIDLVETVSATTFHRHYRHYANTSVFVGSIPDEVLLLHTSRGPFVVGLPDADEREALHSHLETSEAEASAPVPQA